MASVTRKKGAKGKWLYRIQFYDAYQNRYSRQLGAVSQQHANTVKGHIENLVNAQKHNSSLDARTDGWLRAEAPRLLIEWLAEIGLCDAVKRITLGEFISKYIESRTDFGENTTRNYKNSQGKLTDFFGYDLPVDEIDEGDADEWRQSLVDHPYKDATISKAVKHAKHFFSKALRKGFIRKNPFRDLRAGGEKDESRNVFVPREIIDKAIEAAPNIEWKMIIALARYGGLRCPSEIQILRWSDINWDGKRIKIHSPKTKRQGKPFREIPLFPELEPFLREGHEITKDESAYVVTEHRQKNANLRTQFLRILEEAGIAPWERLFQNLRTSRQNELADEYPTHVATAWIGNSELVASRHYLKVKDSHYEQAIGAKSSAMVCESVPNPTPQDTAVKCTGMYKDKKGKGLASKPLKVIRVMKGRKAPPRGVEPLFSG